MNALRRLWLRLRAIVARRTLEHDMHAEMREHIERATERLIARGMTPEEARATARREFGNAPMIQEAARDARGTQWIAALAGDVRFALRFFARNRLHVAIIVSVFALGIGANTALVTAVQSQFQRPAPVVPDDDALVLIRAQQRATRAAGWRTRGLTHAEMSALAAYRELFADVAAWLAHDVVISPDDSVPRGVGAHFVTPGYFRTLGVGVAFGTGFTISAESGADFSAVISFDWAERLYGVAANAVGQRVRVNDVPVRVVGVAAPAFQGALRNMGRPALWIPVSARAEIARVSPRWLADDPSLEVFARMAPHVARERAIAATQLVVARTLPDSATRIGMARVAEVFSLHALLPESSELILVFTTLGVIGLLLLLVTCTNVSSLIVASAVARRHEIAVRLSLGASRARIVRQLLTESTMLAVAGGAAGLTVCWGMLRAFGGRGGTVDGNSVSPDVYTVGWMLVIAIATGVLFGLSPALHATRTGVATALRDSGTGGSRRSGLQRGLVVAQSVVSLPLLVLLGATLSMVLGEYEPLRPEVSERVVRVTFRPLQRTGAPGQRREAVDSLIPRLVSHPNIASVVPEAGWHMVRRFRHTVPAGGGTERTAFSTLNVLGVAPGWFALLDVPILLGRDVTLADTAERLWPVVVGSALARTFWSGANPIGRTFSSPGSRDTVTMIVVGVYDARHTKTLGNDSLSVFTAQGMRWRRDAILVRARGDADAFMPELQRTIRSLAPGLPVAGTQTLAQADESTRNETLAAGALVGAGGAMALLLASLGLYGVIALAVRQRTREIGIRIALGAKPGGVTRMFLASGMRLGAIALVIGLPLSMVALRFLLTQSGLLAPHVHVWQVGAGVAAILLAVAAVATWIPARRAATIDPALTLRTE